MITALYLLYSCLLVFLYKTESTPFCRKYSVIFVICQTNIEYSQRNVLNQTLKNPDRAEAIFVVGQTIIEYLKKNVLRHFLRHRETKGQICRRLDRQRIKS